VIHDKNQEALILPRVCFVSLKKNCNIKNGLKFPQILAKVVQFTIGKTHFPILKGKFVGKNKSPALTNGSLEQ
jgi:hypothetical protein